MRRLRTALAFPPRLLAGLAAVSSALFLRYVDPAVSGLFPPCAIFAFTGWYCSGCGTARAVHQLLHGKLSTALHFNALAVLMLPVVALALLGGRFDLFTRLGARGIWLLLAGILAFGIARNIPAFPFVLLAPP